MKSVSNSKWTLHNTILDLRLHIYSFAAEEKDSFQGRWLVAAKIGDLDALEALEGSVQSQLERIKQNHPRDFETHVFHAWGNIHQQKHVHMECMLYEHQWKTLQICEHLARGGHIQGLKWARSKNCPWDARTFTAAIMGGHWHVAQYLKKEHCPWDESACTAAATTANWPALHWLQRNHCPWNKQTFAAAVQHGDGTVLKWIRQEGCPFDETSCEAAARFGKWDILKWLRDESCPWNLHTAAAAAEGGHLELLLWLRDEGCPYHELVVYKAAARGGHYKMIQTLKQDVFHVPSYNIRIR